MTNKPSPDSCHELGQDEPDQCNILGGGEGLGTLETKGHLGSHRAHIHTKIFVPYADMVFDSLETSFHAGSVILCKSWNLIPKDIVIAPMSWIKSTSGLTKGKKIWDTLSSKASRSQKCSLITSTGAEVFLYPRLIRAARSHEWPKLNLNLKMAKSNNI